MNNFEQISGILKPIYRFLGGVKFAMILIGTTAFAVIIGTFIESSTQSHLFASKFTYSNPLFALLIWGFFVNILLSALRRWPFKLRHIPFLITHFGLLMILAGVLVKIYFGVQGNMSVIEGGASRQIFTNGSYALHVEDRGNGIAYHPLETSYNGDFRTTSVHRQDGLKLSIGNSFPHTSEWLSSWVKGDQLHILGLSPIPITEINPEETAVQNPIELPVGAKVRFYAEASPFDIYALRTHSVANIIERLYIQTGKLRSVDRNTGKILSELPLEHSNAKPLLSFSPISGFDNPGIVISNASNRGPINQCGIDLSGPYALINCNLTTPYLGSAPIAYELVFPSTLAFIEDDYHDIHIISISPAGEIAWQVQRGDAIQSLLCIDDGFGGYGIQATLPFPPPKNPSVTQSERQAREALLNHSIAFDLELASKAGLELSPPLEIWQKMCVETGAQFSTTLLDFLSLWDATGSWIFPKWIPIPDPMAKHLSKLNWKQIPLADLHACQWTASLFEDLDPELISGADPLDVLKTHHWPLIDGLINQCELDSDGNPDPKTLLTLLTQQVFAAADAVPSIEDQPLLIDPSPHRNAALLSAYLRAYGIHLSNILSLDLDSDSVNALLAELSPREEPIKIETTVIPGYMPTSPGTKIEDVFPLIQLKAMLGETFQSTYLAYDKYGTGLKWPILNGQYLVRFQPCYEEIPYKIRLRNARQINYPNSFQAYSYESDLIITDLRTGVSNEQTVSMNNVHETWDGYRFYLASMNPSEEGSLKRIQLVVNHDPAKYWLTYPGAMILTLGIVLLFAFRP